MIMPSNDEVLRVYFKGLVSDETVKNVKMSFGGIGVAICDTSDRCVFELRKYFLLEAGDRGIECDVVELKALIHGLNVAEVNLGSKRVQVFCDRNSVYQYLTGKGKPTNKKIAELVEQLDIVQRKFTYCGPSLVSQNDVKFASKLARDAIDSEINKWTENDSDESLEILEQCTICYEYVASGKMFTVKKCLHRYCFSCMNKPVEAKLHQAGQLPGCPFEKCTSKLEIESCKKFLNAELYHIMSLRIKEASIPPTEKVYCPFSNCSTLMSKTELQKNVAASTLLHGSGMRKCVKCDRPFCINCKVGWHDNITCSDYMKSFLYQSTNEAKLKSLALTNRWRQCVKCSNMVELAMGCYHIYCRCGYEFCYTCGAAWINKKASCRCPLWDERYILYAEQNRH